MDKFVLSVGGKTVTENYIYEKDNLISKVQSSLSAVTTDYNYDGLNRLKNTVTTLPSGSLTHSYTYEASDRGSGYTTTKIGTETIGNITYKYTYDKSYNITAISKKAKGAADSTYVAVASYEYDGFGRLTRENVAPDGSLYYGHTMVYNYDNGGNITKRTEYPYTTGSVGTARDTVAYDYTDSNWKDKLTSYDGSTITYDAIGNPLSYRGYTLTWAGRKLTALSGTCTNDASLTATYQYDMDGIRTSKTVNGVKHTYYYEGSQLRYEQWGSEKLYFTYDGLGNLSAISHVKGTTTNHYYVMTNSRGDVEYIYNTSGSLVAQYTYDAWGNVLTIKDGSGASITSTTHIGNINPIRYRGYYYDVESGLYYLNSRYYDAEVGRFISGDGYIFTGTNKFGANMFAYCEDNPVNRVDRTGLFWEELQIFVSGFVNTIKSNVYVFAGSAGLSFADGPLPILNVVGAIVSALVVIAAIDHAVDEVTKAKEIEEFLPSIPETEDTPELDDKGNPVVKPGQQPTEKDGYIAPKGGNMTASEINQKALDALTNQNWKKAQQLLFENVRNNPSHKTYNNLGFYLISEGLLCKNGRFRNAHKIGMKYLLRAAELKDSQVTLCAIAKAYDYELRTSVVSKRDLLYKQTYLYLDKALKIKYSDEIQYNVLRILCLMNKGDEDVLKKTRTLIEHFVCEESISLYFQLICIHSLVDEGLQCIECYGEYLNEVDLLMFYSKFGFYEKGYNLCEVVCSQFSPDEYMSSAVIECCINSGHFLQAEIYAQRINEIEDDIQYAGKDKWCKRIFNCLSTSTNIRRKNIAEYLALPPFLDCCCYYGCNVHRIAW